MKFHLVVPAGVPSRATLPSFITDVRPADLGFEPRQAARTAELAGLDGVLVPFDPAGLDPLVLAATLLRETTSVQVTAEFHPAIATPVYAAKLSASLQRFTASRLAWRLAVDLDPAVARSQGDFVTGQDRYARAAEFLSTAKDIWTKTAVSKSGRFYQVLDGGLPASPGVSRQFPRVYLSGTSPEALALSAAHADVHVLSPGDDPSVVPPGVARAVLLPDLRLVDEYAAQGVSEFFVASADAFAIREVAGVG
jgi:alkanesulfonate monooxygenase SsuD/methylene tetrahydromethanopterin reductase-like flavin-dependent oxidoreductase (luciferase family)